MFKIVLRVFVAFFQLYLKYHSSINLFYALLLLFAAKEARWNVHPAATQQTEKCTRVQLEHESTIHRIACCVTIEFQIYRITYKDKQQATSFHALNGQVKCTATNCCCRIAVQRKSKAKRIIIIEAKKST